MIILHNAKPAEGMSLRGLFQLTGVAMVDPHDNKTMQLPFAMKHARWSFLLACMSSKNAPEARIRAVSLERARVRLFELGGLASPW